MALYKKIKKGDTYQLLSGECITNLSNFSIRLRIEKTSETQNAPMDEHKENENDSEDLQEPDQE